MDAHEFWYRTLFRLKMYEVSGYAFQRLFNKVMECAEPGYQAIAPWGSWGDGGNDGWVPTTGHYYQLYGPEPTTKFDPVGALDKAITDFHKLPAKWGNVKAYSFVANDRFTGAIAPIASQLQALQTNYGLTSAAPVSSAEVLATFMSLTDGQRQDILGGVPSTIPSFVDVRAVAEVLAHLADRVLPLVGFLTDTAPIFATKIALNNLTSPITEYLRVSSWHVSSVDQFLQARGGGLDQAIAGEMRSLYAKSMVVVPDSDEDASNARYVWMIEELIPPARHDHPHSLKAYRDAAQLVIAKYFETCDVYEHPSSAASA